MYSNLPRVGVAGYIGTQGGRNLARDLNLAEVFEAAHGRPAASYPARLPFLNLDRIYVRGFRVKIAHVHRGRSFSKLSDHVALSALLTRV